MNAIFNKTNVYVTYVILRHLGKQEYPLRDDWLSFLWDSVSRLLDNKIEYPH